MNADSARQELESVVRALNANNIQKKPRWKLKTNSVQTNVDAVR